MLSAIFNCLITVFIFLFLTPNLWASGACSTTKTTSGQNTIEFCTDTTATTWTVPAGANTIQVDAIGAGGGGGFHGGSGGGGGAYAIATGISVTSGTSINISVGSGGAGGVSTGSV